MKKVEYSKIVQIKLLELQQYLNAEFGEESCTKIITEIYHTLENLNIVSVPGISIRDMYDIDTDDRSVYCCKNYFIISVNDDKIIIKQMFNEKEDFISKLF